ncbi:hypothetical protein QJ854_gp315 [Moumouvirus goulette]|uniref:Uncharacterized protein n=1 Tax=Moumouvirus goulette TaxID=1247379 RepID=M1PXI5_9VIRU|nr:hypothetical protein QJ854_gp315 [Moumouvirus goulette]AGF85467.1 hypothetical protein glt_00659 [Moumouvirus goulette]
MSISNKILSIPISSLELSKAYDQVIENYGGNDNDWYILQETEDVARDNRLIKHGQKPMFSDIYRDYPKSKKIIEKNHFMVEKSESDDVEIININELNKPLPLPDPIALIAEWQSDGHWTTEIVSVMKTIQEFWIFMHELQKEDNSYCKFSMPLQGMESLADKIFSELISSGRSREDHVIIDKNLQNRVNTIVANYNSLHPVWSFIKTSDLAKRNNIQVPFIRKNHRAVNDININLKDTKFNGQRNIYTMNKTFTEGYIPFLVFDFIRGQLPDDIRAIVFNKTIAVHGNSYFKGFRVRVLTKTDEYSCLQKCKNYLENHFIDNHSSCGKNYTECVVRISLPK